MFVVLKKKSLLFLLIGIMVFTAVMIYANYKTEYVSADNTTPKYTVVVDAGHGGVDGGSIGKNTGTKESDINLKYALKLADYLKQAGIKVVLTRENSNGLYDISKKNLKKSDMEKRKQIIENSNADCVVSIHMNSFRLTSSCGAQTFYNKDNALGKQLAQSIQQQFVANLDNAKKTTSYGDYFMVNCTEKPSVIVECGFLSNPKEEKLLISEKYQNKVCYLIMCGVLEFLDNKA